MLKTYRLKKKFYITFKLDSIFNNYLLALYINLLMFGGKKNISELFLYKFLYYIKRFLRYRPVKSVMQQFLFSLYTPFIFLTKRLNSFSIKAIPKIKNFKLSLKLGLLFFLSLLKKKAQKNAQVCLLFQILIQQSSLRVFKGLLYNKYSKNNRSLILYKKYLNYRW
jgi:hypothetical protein